MTNGVTQGAAERGWFVSVEGIDGAGKSTHVSAIADALRASGQRVCVTREPGGTPLGEKLRALLLQDEMEATTELLLAFAARRQHLAQVIVPNLASGASVVCDRFTDATYAYQGAGRGVDWALIATLEQAVQSGWTLPPAPGRAGSAAAPLLQPDCTLWFDVPAQVAAERLRDARQPDRFEGQARAFFERVAQGYVRRAGEAPQRIVRIDADRPQSQVAEQVRAVLRARGIVSTLDKA
ncbi:thymidylate kinase [Lampropedia cohaerens]|uniref:Thymidylate kinase n=1 Tax=Lampropedia cohaerens TaxID=1610491 RepID=A0A0U1PYT0_9BURK|nr:dTMP kinase [Lampropedia cohaerens]KKW67679.1 thymidylate kinase [Lampropedia cohaerens]